jgi:uncharacterized delta-60 repeat protein
MGEFASHSFEKGGYTDNAFQRPDGSIWVMYHEYQDDRDTTNRFDVPRFIKTAIVRNNGERILGSDRLLGVGNRFSFGVIFSAATQSDNKLLLVTDVAGFIRLNADGSLDASFKPQTTGGIVLQSDGKILVGAVRLNPDGSRDPSFVPQLDGSFYAVALQTSGKIVVATDSPPYLKRLNSDGSVDPTFVANLDAQVWSALSLPDNAILVREIQFGSDGSSIFKLVRLNQDGSLDAGFHPDARFYYWLAVQPDGKVFANFQDPATGNFFLGRMNRDGTIDSSFQTYPVGPNPVTAVFIQPDSTILVDLISPDDGAQEFVRFDSNGTLNPSSKTAFKIPAAVTNFVAQEAGKLLVSGDFNFTDGVKTGALIRLASDGNLDGAFHPPMFSAPTTGVSLGVQKSGAILFSALTNSATKIAMRLTPDGSLDPSFAQQNLGTVFKIRDDDKILSCDNAPVVRRLLSDGTVDPAFAATKIDFGGSSGNEVGGFAIQADGKVIVFGNADLFGGIHSEPVRAGVTRLNANGGVDSSFTPTAFGSGSRFNCAAIQADGKILLGGRFGSNLIRLNVDGSVDQTFVVSPNYTVSAILIEDSGAILIGGGFTFVNGNAAPGVARINPNGQLDSSFYLNPRGGVVDALAKLSDGRIVIGGDFGLVASPSSRLLNISTRMFVDSGDNALIGGIIITGNGNKKVLIRGIGPSLAYAGVDGALQNPYLELRDNNGALIASNDDWQNSADPQAIVDTTIPPSDPKESAIVATLPANNSAYTAIVRPAKGAGGIGLVEVYDLDGDVSSSKLANISTRGNVLTGDKAMIGGFIIAGPLGAAPTKVLVRALGPSVPLNGVLQDPTLELHQGSVTLATNDNWKDTQQLEIEKTTIPPRDDRESAIVMSLEPTTATSFGSYTAIVRGKNNSTGIGLLEVYDVTK